MLAAIFKTARGIEIPTPFPRLTYREAIDTFGSDKPDRRFNMKLIDFGDVFRSSQFKVFQSALAEGGVVKAINAKHFAGITIGQVDEMTAIAKTFGAKGLAFIKVELLLNAGPARTWTLCGSPIFHSCNGARKKINGTRCIIHSLDRKRKIFRYSSRRNSAKCAPMPTTLS